MLTPGGGDGGLHSINNNAIQVWDKMKCFRFEFIDNPGIYHGDLSFNLDVQGRLLTNLQRPRSVCSENQLK